MRRLQGSIVKYKNGYRVFVTKRDSEGNIKRFSKVVNGSRADAEKVLKQLQDKNVTYKTFGEVCKAYMDNLDSRLTRNEIEASTVRGYKSNIECHILPKLGKMNCETIKPLHLERFLTSLQANRLSVYKTLRQIYKWGLRMEIVVSNPMDKVTSPKVNPPAVKRDDIYTIEECQELLNCDMSDKLRIAVCIALGCGLRRGEICGLEWSDYDGKYLSINKSFGKNKPKTENGIRKVSVPKFVCDVLNEFVGGGMILDLKPDSLTRMWIRFLVDNPQIRKLPFKNLRHTSLSIAYEQSSDLLSVSRRAGHSSIYITDRFYVRNNDKMDERISSFMDNVMKGKP